MAQRSLHGDSGQKEPENYVFAGCGRTLRSVIFVGRAARRGAETDGDGLGAIGSVAASAYGWQNAGFCVGPFCRLATHWPKPRDRSWRASHLAAGKKVFSA